MIRSFLNYPGGKYRLLNQILPHFPRQADSFVDMFAGSAVVSVNNLTSNSIKAYDSNRQLIELLQYVADNTFEHIIDDVDYLIAKYGLSDTMRLGYSYYAANSASGMSKYNKSAYEALRTDYNQGKTGNVDKAVYLYTLIIFGFNNQIRFNSKGMFNNPTGKRDFNSRMRIKLDLFKKKIDDLNIEFINADFREISSSLNDSFYYADPPYLITGAVYNDNMGGWNSKDELDLYDKLDEINAKGNKFALSNVFSSKGKTNKLLCEWSKKYNVYHLKQSYGNSNYQTSNKKGGTDEVLITNY